MKNLFILLIIGLLLPFQSCQTGESHSLNAQNNTRKTGVLLVNHGSRSATWRQALLNLETAVEDSIIKSGAAQDVMTAFMEYTEPSIATRLKQFDSAGYTDVIIVPIFLTVSSHSFDDIPTIIGQKDDPQSIEAFKLEKIERYTPKARIVITPLLDFTDVLKKNVLRRVQQLSKEAASEGLVLIAYGDQTYNTEWSALMDKVGAYVKENTGVQEYSYGWCGHLVHYNPDSTTAPIKRVLAKKDKALVVPVLVAHDEMFQVKIIGDGIAAVKNAKEKVLYKPDSILPDANVQNWVLSIVKEYATKLEQPVAAK